MIGDCIAVVACVGHTVRVTEGVGFLVNTIPIEIYGGCRWTETEIKPKMSHLGDA